RRHRVHHPHPGAGGHRPVPAGADRALLRRVRRAPGAAHPAGRRGGPDQVQHGLHGPAPGAAGQRREPAARPRQPANVPGAEVGWTESAFDPDVLTIGFARRVPSYKRLTLMLRDPDRLKALLLDPQRPVQLVIAGKSHPADDGGKQLIQQMVQFADDPAIRHRIAFLPGYDIGMARYLYWGCDVWLNNPRSEERRVGKAEGNRWASA